MVGGKCCAHGGWRRGQDGGGGLRTMAAHMTRPCAPARVSPLTGLVPGRRRLRSQAWQAPHWSGWTWARSARQRPSAQQQEAAGEAVHQPPGPEEEDAHVSRVVGVGGGQCLGVVGVGVGAASVKSTTSNSGPDSPALLSPPVPPVTGSRRPSRGRRRGPSRLWPGGKCPRTPLRAPSASTHPRPGRRPLPQRAPPGQCSPALPRVGDDRGQPSAAR